MTNADKFKNIFGLYATELWSMPEKDFLKWLNGKVLNCSEFPNNSDTISRQRAIDAVNHMRSEDFDGLIVNRQKVESILKALPSVQPDIIRCKDCKWYGRADKRRFYRGMDCLQKRIDTIVPDRDFCSKAERRERDE